jgi:translation initiation factor IF-2
MAEAEGVDIRFYDIIYNLIEDIEGALKGMKEPNWAEVVDGRAEVRAVFAAGKREKAAGLFVSEGKLRRDSLVRVVRGGKVIHQSKIVSLRRFKDDVKEVATGTECGLVVDGFTAFEPGDIIEAYRRERVG